MSTPKFTRGPRSVGGRCGNVKDEHVAVAVGRDGAAAFFGSNAVAEATLYAASPDLYAALKPFADLEIDGPVIEAGLEQAVLDARAALAKAGGES